MGSQGPRRNRGEGSILEEGKARGSKARFFKAGDIPFQEMARVEQGKSLEDRELAHEKRKAGDLAHAHI